jgi:hypothetical protein
VEDGPASSCGRGDRGALGRRPPACGCGAADRAARRDRRASARRSRQAAAPEVGESPCFPLAPGGPARPIPRPP